MNLTGGMPYGLRLVDPLYRYGVIRISGSFAESFFKNVISREKNLLFRMQPQIPRRKIRVFPPIMLPVLKELELLTKGVAARVSPQIERAVACIPEKHRRAFPFYESACVPKVPVRVLGPAGEHFYQAIRALGRGAVAVAFCRDRGLISEDVLAHVEAAEHDLQHVAGNIVRLESLFRRNTQVVFCKSRRVLSVAEELKFRQRHRIRARTLAACDTEDQTPLKGWSDPLDLTIVGQYCWPPRIDLNRSIEMFLSTVPQDR